MAVVKPFRALRFDSEFVELSRALCPPYDIIGSREACLLRKGRFNAIHLELPAGEGAAKYRRAAKAWKSWRRRGILAPDPEPSFYVLEERFRAGGRALRRLGFLGTLGTSPSAAREVLRHERTLPKPKTDRLRLLKAVRANTSPIFGLFRDPAGGLRRVLRRASSGRPSACASWKSVSYRLYRPSPGPGPLRGVTGRAPVSLAAVS